MRAAIADPGEGVSSLRKPSDESACVPDAYEGSPSRATPSRGRPSRVSPTCPSNVGPTASGLARFGVDAPGDDPAGTGMVGPAAAPGDEPITARGAATA